MKILIVNDQFERGGAARVAAILCNGLFVKGYEVVVATDSINYETKYSINSNVRILQIQSKSNTGRFRRWTACSKTIRKYIQQENPDIIIAIQSLMFLVVWIANIGLGKKIIAADHTSFNIKSHPLLDFIRYHLYRYADALSILTKKDEKLLGNKFPHKKVIYNPLPFPILSEPVCRRQHILCVGRLESWYIKGFDIILDIWKQIEANFPEWKLVIAGSGDAESTQGMKNMISDRGLINRVDLLGQVDNMRLLYQQSSVFVLSSRVEGFPMGLMEAMSQGCACVAFSVYGAIKEMMSVNSGIIIDDGDIDGLKNAIIRVLENDSLRNLYAHNAITEISQFSEDRFIQSWDVLLNDVVKGRV